MKYIVISDVHFPLQYILLNPNHFYYMSNKCKGIMSGTLPIRRKTKDNLYIKGVLVLWCYLFLQCTIGSTATFIIYIYYCFVSI